MIRANKPNIPEIARKPIAAMGIMLASVSLAGCAPKTVHITEGQRDHLDVAAKKAALGLVDTFTPEQMNGCTTESTQTDPVTDSTKSCYTINNSRFPIPSVHTISYDYESKTKNKDGSGTGRMEFADITEAVRPDGLHIEFTAVSDEDKYDKFKDEFKDLEDSMDLRGQVILTNHTIHKFSPMNQTAIEKIVKDSDTHLYTATDEIDITNTITDLTIAQRVGDINAGVDIPSKSELYEDVESQIDQLSLATN